MPARPRFSLPTCATVVLGAVAVFSIAPLGAQETAPNPPSATAPGESFAFEIGHASKAGVDCTVYATQPVTSKLTGQKIRLKVVTVVGFDRTTHYFSLATGKYKAVAPIDAALVEAFRHFLAIPPPAPGQELGKIGDVQHGGEVRLVVASADLLRFDSISPGQPVRSSNFNREAVAGLLAALTGSPAM